jgi:outer membrane lipoprotein SlyB
VATLIFVAGCVNGCVEQAPAAIERGRVISVRPTDQAGENSGAGGVAALVLGTAAGAAIGGQGVGRAVGAIVGAIAGGATGAIVEGASQSLTGIAYTIKLTDGRVITVVEHHPSGDPVYGVGNPVAVETRGRTQHVTQAIGMD